MWVDVFDSAQLADVTSDLTSERLPASGCRGLGVQNLSPYTLRLLSDTGQTLLLVPPWVQQVTTTLETGASWLKVATLLAASPPALQALLKQYRVRLLTTVKELPESSTMLPGSGDQSAQSAVSYAAGAGPFAATKGVYVGATGTLVATMADGSEVTFSAVAAGVVLPISITAIGAASTATGIVGLY